MSDHIRVPVEINITQAVVATALCAIVVPVSLKIGSKLADLTMNNLHRTPFK